MIQRLSLQRKSVNSLAHDARAKLTLTTTTKWNKANNSLGRAQRNHYNTFAKNVVSNNQHQHQHQHQNHQRHFPSSSPLFRFDQTRSMGRNDGNSAFYKPRKPSKKQLKKYHKRKRDEYHQNEGRHSKPGSVAGPLREEKELVRQEWVGIGAGKTKPGLVQKGGYDYGDALLDDLFGNTAGLTSAPTPKPLNMKGQYDKHYTLVTGLMNNYNAQLAMIDSNTSDDNNDTDDNDTNALSAPLPTDKQISFLLRSYRDKYSKSHKPIGIAKALQHLMVDVKVPTDLYGEYTYSALMYCAASPQEARRIMQMMVENGHSPGQYAYSILVDIHAKIGDFRGADEAVSEMKFEGIDPTLAAYTSLMAACYKAINTASIPISIKAEAGKLAWERWKELRINGLDPDVMCYGAIIRIMAARGLPERAINLIEEMQMMGVKPTTLIFTASLKAVARSHANTLRFEGGFSKKKKRRETITAHHGKMAKQIVVFADQAEVEQDDGFASALMLCAATAGDAATAKAIYLASEVRKLQHMRAIGGPDHLRMLRGEDPEKPSKSMLEIASRSEPIESDDSESNDEEDFDLDKMLKEISSEESDGDIDSDQGLHDLLDKLSDSKLDEIIDGMSETDMKAILGEISASGFEGKLDELVSDKKLDLDGDFDKILEDESLSKELMNAFDSGTSDSDTSIDDRSVSKDLINSLGSSSSESDESVQLRRENQDTRKLSALLRANANAVENRGLGDMWAGFENKGFLCENSLNLIVARYQPKYTDKSIPGISGTEAGLSGMVWDEDDDAHLMGKRLRRKKFMGVLESEDGNTVDDLDPDLYDLLVGDEENDEDKVAAESGEQHFRIDGDIVSNLTATEVKDGDYAVSDDVAYNVTESEIGIATDIIPLRQKSTSVEAYKNAIEPSSSLSLSNETSAAVQESRLVQPKDELDIILNGMPPSRIKKVREEVNSSLGDPSILSLIPLLRENMPDYINTHWLREKNVVDAQFVMEKAKKDDVVDSHILNSMLQVLAKSKRIEDALVFYDDEYALHNIESNANSDRAILQMLVASHKITRSLEFKDKVEKKGRQLDLLSYGSLIEYFGNNSHLGSAISLLKECKAIHGSPPGEKSLKQIRIKCRQQGLVEEFGLEELIGKDPLQWIKRGENELKREHSKKGRRNVQLLADKLVNI